MKRLSKPSRIFTCLLALTFVYALLDTFVIPRAQTQAAGGFTQTIESSRVLASATLPGQLPEPAVSEEPVISDTAYDDGKLSVSISTIRAYNSTVYLADVQINDAKQLQTAFAHDTFGRNITEKTSVMAEQNDAVLAINGDYYGSQRAGYVIRNGVLYRGTSAGREDLVIWQDGSMSFIDEDEISAEELLSQGALQVMSFGPALIRDGAVQVTEDEEVGRAKASNPRTAIAEIEPGHYLIAVSDGRTADSEGLSLYELAQVLKAEGAQNAYNLDGGGSSTMVFLGRVVNYPTTNGRYSERAVSDILYF